MAVAVAEAVAVVIAGAARRPQRGRHSCGKFLFVCAVPELREGLPQGSFALIRVGCPLTSSVPAHVSVCVCACFSVWPFSLVPLLAAACLSFF